MVLGIVVGVVSWWVHKRRKPRKDTTSKYQTLLVSLVRRMKAGNSHVCTGQPISV